METWLILALIFLVFLCLVGTVVFFIAYCGAFQDVEVKAGQPPLGQVTIAYKFCRGSYSSDVGPEFFEIAKIAPDNKAISIYYDDPENASVSQRFVVACVVGEGEEEGDAELVKKFEAEGYKITQLPLVQYAVHSSFSYTSALSVFIGFKKVYPKMQQYLQEHGLQGHPFMEIYQGSSILYMAPLEQQDSFYVPEALQSPTDQDQDHHNPNPDPNPGMPCYQEFTLPRMTDTGEDGKQQGLGAGDDDDGVKLRECAAEHKLLLEGGKEESVKGEMPEKAGEGDVKKECEPAEKVEDTAADRSDEESSSSFEDLKLEADEAIQAEVVGSADPSNQ